MKQEEPILVAIHCLVYNHEPYEVIKYNTGCELMA